MSVTLTIDDVLAFHAVQLARYGGAPGVRDMGLVEAALYRPQTGYYKDILEEAAALWESFLMNHPFVDGNKRTAFMVTDVYLRVNGISITAGSKQTGDFLYGLFDTGEVTFKNLDAWLRNNTRVTPR
ncbi:type II toxin-antitoxin system death-on-curing family toxin [Fretibacter rubidus]|uniref:type II toxin-antitoxin system death-on-curing family toxin n=1 Tax=Fretibacter rubidus TaxID=570162 RepID=UPI00352BC5D1